MSLRLDQTTIQTSKKDIALKVHNQSLYSTHFPSVYDTSEINFSAIFSNYLIKITYYRQIAAFASFPQTKRAVSRCWCPLRMLENQCQKSGRFLLE